MSTSAERRVLIRGCVFPYNEKAPFVASGKSVLGALEYCESSDMLKCHECGEWFENLGSHLQRHEISASEYKLRHGLNQRSGLVGLRLKRTLSVAGRGSSAASRFVRQPGLIAAGHRTQSLNAELRKPRARKREKANIDGVCQAQLLYRIQIAAARLEHTPTCKELSSLKIHPSTLIDAFGSVELAMRKAGLIPNKQHAWRKVATLPPDFAPDHRLNEPMPWPKGYPNISVEHAYARKSA